jgi:hypothetical protein
MDANGSILGSARRWRASFGRWPNVFRMKFKVADCDLKHLPTQVILMWSQFATTSRMTAEDRTHAVTNCDRVILGSWKLCE